MNQAPDILSKRRQLLAATALVPLLGALGQPIALQSLIYSFFVCVYLTPFVIEGAKKKKLALAQGGEQAIQLTEERSPSGDMLAEALSRQMKSAKKEDNLSLFHFAFTLVAAGMVSECLAWLTELFATSSNPALLHPQFFADLYLAFFYYAGLAAAWLILSTRFAYALKEIFFVSFLAAMANQARLGALAALCEKLVSDPVTALLTIASLIVVGGSVASLGFLAGHKVREAEKKPPLLKLVTKYAISFALVAILPYLSCLGGGLAGKPLGLCPEKKPIWEAPLI